MRSAVELCNCTFTHSLILGEVLFGCVEGKEDGRRKYAEEAVGQARICVLLLNDDRPPLKGGR